MVYRKQAHSEDNTRFWAPEQWDSLKHAWRKLIDSFNHKISLPQYKPNKEFMQFAGYAHKYVCICVIMGANLQLLFKHLIRYVSLSLHPLQKMFGRSFAGDAFLASPSEIVFPDFEVGRSYSAKVQVINRSYQKNSFRCVLERSTDVCTFSFSFTLTFTLTLKFTFTLRQLHPLRILCHRHAVTVSMCSCLLLVLLLSPQNAHTDFKKNKKHFCTMFRSQHFW